VHMADNIVTCQCCHQLNLERAASSREPDHELNVTEQIKRKGEDGYTEGVR